MTPIPVFVEKARVYFATLSNTAKYAEMTDEELYEYLCSSPMNFYQIVPSRIVVTSPWFLNVFDTGYSRQFISEELQGKLLAAVNETYPDAVSLTTMGSTGATGLKTQQTLLFD